MCCSTPLGADDSDGVVRPVVPECDAVDGVLVVDGVVLLAAAARFAGKRALSASVISARGSPAARLIRKIRITSRPLVARHRDIHGRPGQLEAIGEPTLFMRPLPASVSELVHRRIVLPARSSTPVAVLDGGEDEALCRVGLDRSRRPGRRHRRHGRCRGSCRSQAPASPCRSRVRQQRCCGMAAMAARGAASFLAETGARAAHLMLQGSGTRHREDRGDEGGNDDRATVRPRKPISPKRTSKAFAAAILDA